MRAPISGRRPPKPENPAHGLLGLPPIAPADGTDWVMADDLARWTHYRSNLATISISEVPGTSMWTIRVAVAYPGGPAFGWVPVVFATEEAAARWLSGRVRGRILPCVRECDDAHADLAVACITTEDGVDLLLSDPMPRTRAAGVAAMFAAEFRSHSRR